MSKANYRWSEDALRLLKALNGEGWGWVEVAEKLREAHPDLGKITATACQKRCNKLLRAGGETDGKPKWSDAALDQVRALHREGKSGGEIAKLLSGKLDGGRVLTRSGVIGLIHRQGWNKGAAAPKANRVQTSSKPARAVVPRQKPSTYSSRNKSMGGGMAIMKPASPSPQPSPRTQGEGAQVVNLPVLVVGVDLIDRCGCAFPVTGFYERPVRFCDADPLEGSPYCAGHRAVMYRPSTRREREDERQVRRRA